MNKQVKLKNKIILTFFLLFLFLFLRQSTYNKLVDDAFDELRNKTITSIHVYKSSVGHHYEFDIKDPDQIDKINSFVNELDKSYTQIDESMSWKGKYVYILSFADDHKIPHKTHVYIYGTDFVGIRIYDYDAGGFKEYRAEINLDNDREVKLANLINEYWLRD